MSTHPSDEPGIRYEKTDAHPGGVVRIGVIVAAVALATALVLKPVMSFLGARQAGFDRPVAPMALPAPAPPRAEEPQEQPFDSVAKQAGSRHPPEPRLQERPFEDITKLRASERETLETYGWVDEKAGIVRIPIEEAMRILVRRGLPARAEAPAPGLEPSPAKPAAGGGPR